MLVYRIQPQGADLHGIETETSNGESAGGVHVFESLSEVSACRFWVNESGVELAEIECSEKDIRENSDYEGSLLLKGRGKIIKRTPFEDTMAIAEFADDNQ